MLPEQEAFILAVEHAHNTFTTYKNHDDFRDLSPRFFVALMDLEIESKIEDWDALCVSFKQAYRRLGAPGDFGYDHPCGKALRAVYDTWNALCAAQKLVPKTEFDPIALGM